VGGGAGGGDGGVGMWIGWLETGEVVGRLLGVIKKVGGWGQVSIQQLRYSFLNASMNNGIPTGTFPLLQWE